MPDSEIGVPHPVRTGAELVDTRAAQGLPAGERPRPHRRRAAGDHREGRQPAGPHRWTGTVAVIVIGTAFMAWRLQTGFFLWNDDLYEFQVAHQYGLSTELVFLNLFQHFAPINRLLHLAALDIFHLDPSGMAWFSVAIAGALLCTVAWLATELALSPLRRTFALVLVAGSIVLVDTLAWMDGGWHGITALIATYLVVAMHVRAIRTGRQLWHVFSVLTFLIGLLTQERAAFALPMLILVDLCLVDRQLPLRTRINKLFMVKWPLVTMALAGVALAVFLKLEYVGSGGGQPPLLLVGRTSLAALTNQLFPQLVGFVPSLWPLPLQLLVLLLLVLIGWWLVRVNRENLGPVVFLGASFALYWGFLVVSPILNESNWVEQSQRYAFYTLVPLALTLSCLRIHPGPAWWARMTPNRKRRTATAAVAVTGLALLSTQYFYTEGPRWDPNRESHNYLQNIADSVPLWTDPAVTLVPTQAPRTVAVDWATALARGEFVQELAAAHWQPGDLTGTVLSFDNTGVLQPTGLVEVAKGQPILPPLYPASTSTEAGTYCLAPSNGDDALRFTLDRPVDRAPALIRLTYSSSQTGEVTGVTLNHNSYRWADWSHPIRTGRHTTLVPLGVEGVDPVDMVQLARVPSGSTFCVQSVEVVVPVVLRPDGSCASMDVYGKAIAVTACPDD